MVKLTETTLTEYPTFTTEIPEPRRPYTTLRCDLSEYAREHTGPGSWTADEAASESLGFEG
jgi:hypothetical protein